ncbi:Fructose-2,6-bisphosphatase TIGAR, partial [Orchesella cincta]
MTGVPSSKVVVYLARHAETSGNVNRTITEPEVDLLTDLGKVQTNLLGSHLSTVKIDYAFSSDYGRAVLTAKGVLKQSKCSSHISVKTEQRLREVNFGDYESRSYEETLLYAYDLNVQPLQWSFPGGESFREVGLRMLNVITEICENILVEAQPVPHPQFSLSHSASIVNFCNALHESTSHEVRGWDHAKDLKLMGNASYMRFEVEKTKKDTPAARMTIVIQMQ